MSARASRVAAILAGLWLAVVAGLAVLAPGAIAVATVTAVLQFSTILSLAALGQAVVILCGGAGIDLAVGGTVSLTAMAAMLAGKAGMPEPLLPPLCLGLGLALGLFNGVLVTRLRLLPLIATLGTFCVYSGAALALTGGATLAGVPAYLLPWGRGTLGGVPLTFLSTTVPCFLLAAVVLRFISWDAGSARSGTTNAPPASSDFRSTGRGFSPMARAASSRERARSSASPGLAAPA